ncbi:MAG: porin, partial [Veillonella sp.]|nr:porin [Veillonella sp.]
MIKRKMTSAFAVAAMMGVATAFAVNPFSDVSSDSWAYQAVDQLATAGIINGYPRYEMAQMIAKGMANQDRANAEQQAMLNRLADEFSNELNTLGVRVAKLEDRVGNVKVTGDARINYIGKDGIDGYDYEDKITARVRLGLDAKVNKNTSVKARITTGSIELGDSSKEAQANWDLAYVEHKFGKNVVVDAGRYTQKFGGGL